MKRAQTISILIWASKTQGMHESLKRMLYARVTVNGKRTEISLKREVDESQWDTIAGKVKGRTPQAQDLNIYINEVKSKLLNIYQDLSRKGEFISPEGIKNIFTGGIVQQHTILEVLKLHNEDLKKRIGIDVASSTWTKFNTLEKKLALYITKQLNKTDLYLHQLDYTFISNFEYFLRSVEKINSNTTMKYIRMTKKIMNDAVRKNWLDKNPFQAFKCTFRWPEKEVITWEELNILMERDFAMERLQLVKDYFVFSCFTGLAYIDVVNLKPSSITVGLDGNPWLMFNRQKTGIIVRVPLLDQVLPIIQKYKSHPSALHRNKMFPGISNQKMNSYLKEIGDICGIRKSLTFHLARHTFATTVTLSNGVPIESVSKMLGHAKIATTQIYAKVIEKKLSEDVGMLRQKINKISIVSE